MTQERENINIKDGVHAVALAGSIGFAAMVAPATMLGSIQIGNDAESAYWHEDKVGGDVLSIEAERRANIALFEEVVAIGGLIITWPRRKFLEKLTTSPQER